MFAAESQRLAYRRYLVFVQWINEQDTCLTRPVSPFSCPYSWSLFFKPHLPLSPCSLQSSYILLKTPGMFLPQRLCTTVRPGGLFPQFFSPTGSISSSRSQLKCHLLREALLDLPKQPHPAFPMSSQAFHFLYKSPSECPCAFMYVYCLSPGSRLDQGGPCWLISTLGASKPLQKGFLSRVLPPCLYPHDLWHENSSRNHGAPFQKGLEQISTPIHCLGGQSLHLSRGLWVKLGIGAGGASPSSLLTSPPPANQETGGSPG